MGKEKHGFLTPKAISNRIKARGLQKLKFYCQMCQKQCRDENGFKCHISSEAHNRQMKIFMQNGSKFVNDFSQQFLKGFLDIARRQFGGKRVLANTVYQEYIRDKAHIHMNGTRWNTLKGLCMWLGKKGICKVDETEKGWYLQYVDPEDEARKDQEEKLKLTEEEISKKLLERQIKLNSSKPVPTYEPTELVRDEDAPLKLGLNLKAAQKDEEEKKPKISNPLSTKKAKKPSVNHEAIIIDDEPTTSSSSANAFTKKKKSSSSSYKRTALDDIRDEEEAKKEKKNRRDYWMVKGLEVKLIFEALPERILYRRAVVLNMVDNYTAYVQVLNDKVKLKVDQNHVQTTLPELGERLYCVNGAYRGELALLNDKNLENNTCNITIDTGLCKGRFIPNISMDDVCKLEAGDERLSRP